VSRKLIANKLLLDSYLVAIPLLFDCYFCDSPFQRNLNYGL
jgi:hypothetical protein